MTRRFNLHLPADKASSVSEQARKREGLLTKTTWRMLVTIGKIGYSEFSQKILRQMVFNNLTEEIGVLRQSLLKSLFEIFHISVSC